MNKLLRGSGLVIIAISVLIAAMNSEVQAIPSFARQLEIACNTCHTTFPELTAFGRDFKANGYTMSAGQQIKSGGTGEPIALRIAEVPPFSAMLETAYSRTDRTIPGTQNDYVQFPQQLSFFFAGSISPHMGVFMQITYDAESGQFGWDNTDIRFARQMNLASKNMVYGLTLNNNPTVQDLWNSTPAWEFPYAAPDVAPAPAAGTMIEGGLAQQVAGVGAYTFWNDMVYLEGDVYRSAPQGAPIPPNIFSESTIKHVAPYWRLALQRQMMADNYIEIGTYGMYAQLYPEGLYTPTDKFTDVGFDLQFERSLGRDLLMAHSTFISEKQKLDATLASGGSDNASNSLRTFRLDAMYHLRGWAEFAVAYFSTMGDKDAGLYGPSPIDGSRTGSPDSNGEIFQLQIMPWLNTQLLLQYTIYNKFNGATDNYDGFDRKASDNNTLYALLWVAF
jgi:hypothetical protein